MGCDLTCRLALAPSDKIPGLMSAMDAGATPVNFHPGFSATAASVPSRVFTHKVDSLRLMTFARSRTSSACAGWTSTIPRNGKTQLPSSRERGSRPRAVGVAGAARHHLVEDRVVAILEVAEQQRLRNSMRLPSPVRLTMRP